MLDLFYDPMKTNRLVKTEQLILQELKKELEKSNGQVYWWITKLNS